MKRLTRIVFVGSIGFVGATAGGSAIAATPSAEAPAPATCESTAPPATPEARKEDAAREPYGPVKLVADALSKICLSDDQRAAAEQLGKQVSAKEKAVADARHAFMTALADELKAGAIDENALEPKIDALVKAREEASPVLRKALEDLHGILDPGQRAALADAIEARMKEIAYGSGAWFDAFAKDLALSDDQKSKIRDVLAKTKPQTEEERARAASVFDAFKKDEFSVEAIAPIADVGARARARADRMVANAKEIATILTPEQRAMLASKIEGKSGEMTGSAGTGETQQGLVAARGGSYHAGAVGGWGGGYAAGGATVSGGYAAGYPVAGGYGPGVF